MFKNTFFIIKNQKIHLSQLPLPIIYYQQQFPTLKPYESTWVSVKCCFHEDRQPSLRLNLNNGSFRCFGWRSRWQYHCISLSTI